MSQRKVGNTSDHKRTGRESAAESEYRAVGGAPFPGNRDLKTPINQSKLGWMKNDVFGSQ